jgi:hypothetical protein
MIKALLFSSQKINGLTGVFVNPDFLIADHIKTKDKINIISWGYDCGSDFRYWGPCRGFLF